MDRLIEDLKTELDLVKTELQTIKANQLSGDQKVQLSGTMVSSGLLANRPLASAVPPGFAYYSWDAPEGQEMAYSDGTNWEVKS